MTKAFILLILIMIISCSADTCDWNGDAINEFGTYCNSRFKIKTWEEDDLLKYEVRNSDGDVIIENDPRRISVYQRWGLFLDRMIIYGCLVLISAMPFGRRVGITTTTIEETLITN